MSSVFVEVVEKPLFKSFENYCRATEKDQKIKAYASFVSEIYEHGGSLTDITCRLVFEDENGKLSVDYSKLSVIALKAIDMLNEERKEMKKDIEAIKTKLGL
jgi:hypothetical protein